MVIYDYFKIMAFIDGDKEIIHLNSLNRLHCIAVKDIGTFEMILKENQLIFFALNIRLYRNRIIVEQSLHHFLPLLPFFFPFDSTFFFGNILAFIFFGSSFLGTLLDLAAFFLVLESFTMYSSSSVFSESSSFFFFLLVTFFSSSSSYVSLPFSNAAFFSLSQRTLFFLYSRSSLLFVSQSHPYHIFPISVAILDGFIPGFYYLTFSYTSARYKKKADKGFLMVLVSVAVFTILNRQLGQKQVAQVLVS